MAEELILRGKHITSAASGNVCLNDLYEISGRPENLQASQWMRHRKSQALKRALDDRIVCATHRSQEGVEKSTYYVTGRVKGAKVVASVAAV